VPPSTKKLNGFRHIIELEGPIQHALELAGSKSLVDPIQVPIGPKSDDAYSLVGEQRGQRSEGLDQAMCCLNVIDFDMDEAG
jgi:hypothetical protein